MELQHRINIGKSRLGHLVSNETRIKISNSLKNEKHFNWKDKPTYGITHYWLRTNFGKASICESVACENKSKIYDWALIKGKFYERNRSNFIQLCRKCHIRYDRNHIRIKPKCLDCGIQLKDWYAKRCNSHAQKYRFKKN